MLKRVKSANGTVYSKGGQYEVLIVLDGDWESEDFTAQKYRITLVTNIVERRFGDLYAAS